MSWKLASEQINYKMKACVAGLLIQAEPRWYVPEVNDCVRLKGNAWLLKLDIDFYEEINSGTQNYL